MMLKIIIIIFIGLLECNINYAMAQGIRGINPILSPDSLNKSVNSAQKLKPISKKNIEQAFRLVLQEWNNGRLDMVLADDFYAADHLVDSTQEKVPKDAKITLLSIQGIQVLKQYWQDNIQNIMISEVSITAKTQIEFNDPSPPDGVSSFRRLEGVNEFFIRIRETVEWEK
jgi:hypothetical protein